MMKQSGIIRAEKPSNILVTIMRANNICEQTLGKVVEVSFSSSFEADYFIWWLRHILLANIRLLGF
jgi:hypothetical protein